MRKSEAVANLQQQARAIGWLVRCRRDGTLQLYAPTGARSITAIRLALRQARRAYKRKWPKARL